MKDIKDHEYITGAVNEYRDGHSATGLPCMTDEVYAKRNPDQQSWTVYRLRTHPALLATFTHLKTTPLSQVFFGIAPPSFELPHVVASHVDIRTAFDLVRKHEMAPPQSFEGTLSRQIRRAEDMPTHWTHLNLPT